MNIRKTMMLLLFLITISFSSCRRVPSEVTEPSNPSPSETAEAQGQENVYRVVVPGNGIADLESYQVLPQPKRLRSEYMGEFIPSDEYGQVYPFRAGSSRAFGNYGFCDQTGRIICDGIYNHVTYIEAGEEGFYLCIKESPELLTEFGTWPQIYTIISTKGDYVQEYDGAAVDVWAQEKYTHYISMLTTGVFERMSVTKEGKWGTVDFTGKPELPLIYENELWFSQGRAAIKLSEDSYGYIDIDGQLIGGPFEYEFSADIADVYIYSCERAAFYHEGKWGYLDLAGNEVIAPIYDSSSPFYAGGYASVRNADDNFYIDIWGNPVVPSTAGAEIIGHDGGDWFIIQIDENRFYWNKEEQILPLTGIITSGGWLVQSQKQGKTEFYKDGKTFAVADFIFNNEMRNGNLLFTSPAEDTWILLSSDGEAITERQTGRAVAAYNYIIVESKEGYFVYDENGEAISNQTPIDISQERYSWSAKLPGGYYMTYDTHAGGVRHVNGSWLIRCSYLDSLD